MFSVIKADQSKSKWFWSPADGLHVKRSLRADGMGAHSGRSRLVKVSQGGSRLAGAVAGVGTGREVRAYAAPTELIRKREARAINRSALRACGGMTKREDLLFSVIKANQSGARLEPAQLSRDGAPATASGRLKAELTDAAASARPKTPATTSTLTAASALRARCRESSHSVRVQTSERKRVAGKSRKSRRMFTEEIQVNPT